MTLAELIKTGSLTYVKERTGKAKEINRRYFRSGDAYFLHEVYGHYSRAKYNAWEYCRNLQSKLEGHGGVIASHNTYAFTFAFIVVDDNHDEYVVYITPKYNYITKRVKYSLTNTDLF